MSLSITELKQNLPREGVVEKILVRPEKFIDPLQKQSVTVSKECGLEGDHYTGGDSKKRQVTLIQQEHIPVIASLVGLDSIDPSLLRRNIIVSGINLLALKDCVFTVGSAHLRMTGLCHPCSRMEKILGPGAYNAMRGHGGINATVVQDGKINIGDHVSVLKFD